MTGEMYWLALSIGLCLLIWIPYTSLYAGVAGIKAGTTNVPPTAKLPEWAQRCHRAHMNLVETLVPFATLILMLKVTGKAPTADPEDSGLIAAVRSPGYLLAQEGQPERILRPAHVEVYQVMELEEAPQ